MISINFLWAVAAYLFIFILLLFCNWLFYNYTRIDEDLSLNLKFFRHCPICSHIFFDYSEGKISACPRCNSLIRQEEE
jgi:hypothetical protein